MKIDKKFESSLFDFLHENGMELVDMTTGKSISVGHGDKDWNVRAVGELQCKEYSTLNGALREVGK